MRWLQHRAVGRASLIQRATCSKCLSASSDVCDRSSAALGCTCTYLFRDHQIEEVAECPALALVMALWFTPSFFSCLKPDALRVTLLLDNTSKKLKINKSPKRNTTKPTQHTNMHMAVTWGFDRRCCVEFGGVGNGKLNHPTRVSSRPLAAVATIFAAIAAAAGMINLNTPRCRGPECYLTPYFGLPGATPTYCSKHKQEGMINLISKRCEDESCDRIPSYNYDMVGAKAVYCNAHKAEGGLSAEGVQRQMVRSFAPVPSKNGHCSVV